MNLVTLAGMNIYFKKIDNVGLKNDKLIIDITLYINMVTKYYSDIEEY